MCGDTYATDNTTLYLQYNAYDTATCVTYITNYICDRNQTNKQKRRKTTEGMYGKFQLTVLLTHRYFPCWFTLALKTLNIESGKKKWMGMSGRKERETPN